MTLDEFDKKHKRHAEWIGQIDDYKEKARVLRGAFYYKPSEYKNENDYVIYLIKGKCDDSGYCNHEYFLIELFRFKKFSTNFVLSFCIILLIELFQYVFKVGVLDIDDLILCTFGMMIFNIIYTRIKKDD